MTRLDAITTEGDDHIMSLDARIIQLRHARCVVSDVRYSAAPAGTPTRTEVADALEAILDLLAPLADLHPGGSVERNLITAAAAWGQPDLDPKPETA